MSTLDLDAIQARADAATEGPWTRGGRNGVHTTVFGCVALTFSESGDQKLADAEFIAAARSDVPDLVAALRELRQHALAVKGVVRPEGTMLHQLADEILRLTGDTA